MKKVFSGLVIAFTLTGQGRAVQAERIGTLRQLAVDRTIRGVVKDDKGEGLPGVSIVLKGTTRGTSTDVNGKFEFTAPDQGG
ncbi:MAG TPA: carboxypeptidase-like regulatory domain-containing protein, partial [Dyadobacter sp.]|nr:carboxypeptidase-like regulatory domain-containing protein [Dyadobacter sp.]